MPFILTECCAIKGTKNLAITLLKEWYLNASNREFNRYRHGLLEEYYHKEKLALVQ